MERSRVILILISKESINDLFMCKERHIARHLDRYSYVGTASSILYIFQSQIQNVNERHLQSIIDSNAYLQWLTGAGNVYNAKAEKEIILEKLTCKIYQKYNTDVLQQYIGNDIEMQT